MEKKSLAKLWRLVADDKLLSPGVLFMARNYRKTPPYPQKKIERTL